MKEVILIKNGELALKGLNRSTFEDIMIKNIKARISDCGSFKILKSQSTIIVEPENENADIDEAHDRISRVFGIVAYSKAAAVEKDFEVIKNAAKEFLKNDLLCAETFKVEAKRSDKKFPLASPEICMELGGFLLEEYPHLKVDVHKPQLTISVEIRDNYAFIHSNQQKGAGGMPSGTGGKALLLVSGGIDSPVAGWLMAKRGLRLAAVHFASPPYTSERAEMKVHELLKKLSAYCGRIELFVVPFTEIQEAIHKNCPEEYFTLVMRRFMMKISNEIAKKESCAALITGESLGQVASQTIYALQCTDALAEFPVFRPCIGLDKEEIISISKKINTFDISIQPFEDCCTVFTPRHPKTRPTIENVENAEKSVMNNEIIERAINNTVLKIIS